MVPDAPSDPPHEPVRHLAGAGLAGVGGPVVAPLNDGDGAGGQDCYCESILHRCFRFGCPVKSVAQLARWSRFIGSWPDLVCTSFAL